LQEIISNYIDDPHVAIVTIQTTFEGFGVNNAEVLHDVASDYSLSIPVGHNGWQGKPSPLLFDYKARGTPWVVIIDKSGMIRFNNFYLKPEKAMQLIEGLKKD
jgi:hypothetical protein